jgi:hypothetical protein
MKEETERSDRAKDYPETEVTNRQKGIEPTPSQKRRLAEAEVRRGHSPGRTRTYDLTVNSHPLYH